MATWNVPKCKCNPLQTYHDKTCAYWLYVRRERERLRADAWNAGWR